MSTTHEQTAARLSDYLDGELHEADRAAIEIHLGECAACRDTLNDLRSIAEAARRLPDSLPDRELWNGISMRLETSAATPSQARHRRQFSFTMPQIAAAGLALMVMSGGLVYVALSNGPRTGATVVEGNRIDEGVVVPAGLTDPHYDDAVTDLERTLEAGRDRLDPSTVRVLEENLAAIDKAIEQSRRALEADPANSFLNSHLVSARQRKLALLRRATALTTGS